MSTELKTEELEKLVNICHSNLKNSAKYATYLIKKRKLDVSEVKKYKLGFFPQNINVLLNHVNRSILRETRIIDYFEDSKFSSTHSLIFPIHNEYNEVVGISGRTLLSDDERQNILLAKYEGSSFKKARILYGLNHSRGHILKKKNCYVVEGNIDFMALTKNGFPESVAICGTAFSKAHFLKLLRYTDKITFILDRDEGGIKSMKSICSKYSNKGAKLRFMLLPKGYKDADEYFCKEGNNKDTFLKDLETYIPDWN